MASRPDALRWPLAGGDRALALCWWFGSGLHPLWWLTWLAPPCRCCGWRRACAPTGPLLAALAAYAAGGLSMDLPARLHRPAFPMAIAHVIGRAALVFAPCVLLFRRLLLRGRVLAAALAMPAAWVAIEYVNSLLSPHGTFGNIGYTQMDALPILQVAASRACGASASCCCWCRLRRRAEWPAGFEARPRVPRARRAADRRSRRLWRVAPAGTRHGHGAHRPGVAGEADPPRAGQRRRPGIAGALRAAIRRLAARARRSW